MRISRSIVPRMFRPLFTTQSDQSSLSASLSEPPSPIPRRSFIILSMSIALLDRGGGAVLTRACCTV